MDEELEVQAAEPEEKISFVVGVLGLIIAIIFDLLSLIPFVGDVEEVPAGVMLFLNVLFGMNTAALVAQGVAMGVKAIPLLQEFPAWTTAWLVTWWLENHPSRLTAAIETVAKVEATIESGGVAGEAGAVEGTGAAVAEGAGAAGAVDAAGEAGAGAVEAGAAEGAAVGVGAETEEEAGNARPSERPRRGINREEEPTEESGEGQAKSEEERYRAESEAEYEEETKPMMSPEEELERQLLSEKGPQAESDEGEEENNQTNQSTQKVIEMPKQQTDTEISLEKRRAKAEEIKKQLTDRPALNNRAKDKVVEFPSRNQNQQQKKAA